MFSHPSQRQRYAPDNAALALGVPSSESASGPQLDQVQNFAGNPYRYHEGDIFTPGAQNFVFETPWELPEFSIFGGATIKAWWRQPNTFSVRQPMPDPSFTAYVPDASLGGLIAGQLILEPLVDPTTGGFAEGGYLQGI